MPDEKRTVLVVLFIPSVERDGKTAIDQDHWVTKALETFGKLFGGATAFPKARGVWRDDAKKLAKLRAFCRRMGKGTNQGEIGLVIDGEYLAINDY